MHDCLYCASLSRTCSPVTLTLLVIKRGHGGGDVAALGAAQGRAECRLSRRFKDVGDESMLLFCAVSASWEVFACSRYGSRVHLPASSIAKPVDLRGGGRAGAWVGQV